MLLFCSSTWQSGESHSREHCAPEDSIAWCLARRAASHLSAWRMFGSRFCSRQSPNSCSQLRLRMRMCASRSSWPSPPSRSPLCRQGNQYKSAVTATETVKRESIDCHRNAETLPAERVAITAKDIHQFLHARCDTDLISVCIFVIPVHPLPPTIHSFRLARTLP